MDSHTFTPPKPNLLPSPGEHSRIVDVALA